MTYSEAFIVAFVTLIGLGSIFMLEWSLRNLKRANARLQEAIDVWDQTIEMLKDDEDEPRGLSAAETPCVDGVDTDYDPSRDM